MKTSDKGFTFIVTLKHNIKEINNFFIFLISSFYLILQHEMYQRYIEILKKL